MSSIHDALVLTDERNDVTRATAGQGVVHVQPGGVERASDSKDARNRPAARELELNVRVEALQ